METCLAPVRSTHDVTSWNSHANMGGVTPEEKAAKSEALRKAARADLRAERAKERTRLALRALIVEAAAEGMKPTEIVASIERRYTDAHVSRVIHDKT